VRSPADEHTHGFDGPGLAGLLEDAGLEVLSLQPLWYLTGVVHAGLETLSRVAGLRRPLGIPEVCERLLLSVDAIVARLPVVRRLNWHWSAIARRPSQ
jgi:hypothetical protein